MTVEKKHQRSSVKSMAQSRRVPSLSTRMIHDALWLVALGLVLFVVLSLLSFSIHDPAWSRTTPNVVRMSNLGGIVGAYLADILYYLMGVSAWWLPVAALVWLRQGYQVISRCKNDSEYLKSLGLFGLILILMSSTFWEYVLKQNDWDAYLPVGAGGVFGHLLFAPLTTWLGMVGSLILSLLLLIIGLSLLLQWSWLDGVERVGRGLSQRPDAIKHPQAARRAKRAERITKEPLQTPTVVQPSRKKSDTKSVRQPEKKPKMNPIVAKVGLPTLDLLHDATPMGESVSPEAMQQHAVIIEKKLAEFGIDVKVLSATTGPVITRYEIETAQGVKGSQIVNLSKDLARALAIDHGLRVVETIAGRHTMGIELPNEQRADVALKDVLAASVFQKASSLLTVALGKDVSGKPVVADLAAMPHLLVAGTTGSGKSVAINSMIVSLLYRAHAEDVRMIFIDPKMIELSVYEGIPHLLAPVVTDMAEAAAALRWCVAEMDKRYQLLAHLDVRHIDEFNHKVRKAIAAKTPLPDPFSQDLDQPEPLQPLPYLVIVIDELADLMMVEGKKVEQLIARLAQKARAAGIHLILATQRPSVDVITGLIKANIPTRMAFKVRSKIDSRTILDQVGAEGLLGYGDMLFLPPGAGVPTRLHGAFVGSDEVLRLVAFLKTQGSANYVKDLFATPNTTVGDESRIGAEADPLYDQAVRFVLETRKTSISALQRALSIGYNRAAKIMEAMEAAGVVSAAGVGHTRRVLVDHLTEDVSMKGRHD